MSNQNQTYIYAENYNKQTKIDGNDLAYQTPKNHQESENQENIITTSYITENIDLHSITQGNEEIIQNPQEQRKSTTLTDKIISNPDSNFLFKEINNQTSNNNKNFDENKNKKQCEILITEENYLPTQSSQKYNYQSSDRYPDSKNNMTIDSNPQQNYGMMPPVQSNYTYTQNSLNEKQDSDDRHFASQANRAIVQNSQQNYGMMQPVSSNYTYTQNSLNEKQDSDDRHFASQANRVIVQNSQQNYGMMQPVSSNYTYTQNSQNEKQDSDDRHFASQANRVIVQNSQQNYGMMQPVSSNYTYTQNSQNEKQDSDDRHFASQANRVIVQNSQQNYGMIQPVSSNYTYTQNSQNEKQEKDDRHLPSYQNRAIVSNSQQNYDMKPPVSNDDQPTQNTQNEKQDSDDRHFASQLNRAIVSNSQQNYGMIQPVSSNYTYTQNSQNEKQDSDDRHFASQANRAIVSNSQQNYDMKPPVSNDDQPTQNTQNEKQDSDDRHFASQLNRAIVSNSQQNYGMIQPVSSNYTYTQNSQNEKQDSDDRHFASQLNRAIVSNSQQNYGMMQPVSSNYTYTQNSQNEKQEKDDRHLPSYQNRAIVSNSQQNYDMKPPVSNDDQPTQNTQNEKQDSDDRHFASQLNRAIVSNSQQNYDMKQPVSKNYQSTQISQNEKQEKDDRHLPSYQNRAIVSNSQQNYDMKQPVSNNYQSTRNSQNEKQEIDDRYLPSQQNRVIVQNSQQNYGMMPPVSNDDQPTQNTQNAKEEFKVEAPELSADDQKRLEKIIGIIKRVTDDQKRYDSYIRNYNSSQDPIKTHIKIFYDNFYPKINIPIQPNKVIVKKTPKELLLDGWISLKKTKVDLEEITIQDFLKITKHSCEYNEKGNLLNSKTPITFFQEEQNSYKEEFGKTILQQVFKLLKFVGDFNTFIQAQYFLDTKQENQFFYKASAKVPFYFIYYACPQISDILIERYLDNSFNAISFVTYEQWDGKQIIQNEVNNIKKTINLSVLYPKLKKMCPNLICVGDRYQDKSTVLNSIFNAKFERIENGSAGMFHDSVDVFFDSKEFPTGFNIFDFNGISNEDPETIELLLKTLPCSILLIQGKSMKYIQETLNQLTDETKQIFGSKIIFVDKNEEQSDASSDCLNEMMISFDNFTEEQFFSFGNATTGATFNSKVAELKELIRTTIQQNSSLINEESQQGEIWNFYWQLEDSFKALANQNIYKLNLKDEQFKRNHQRIKQYLRSIKNPQKEFSRKRIFPRYIIELEIQKTKKELFNVDQELPEELKLKLQQEYDRLQNQKLHIQEHQLYKEFKQNFLEERHDRVNDFLALIEASYLPRIKEKQKSIEEIKKKAQKVETQILSFNQKDGTLRNLNKIEENEYNQLQEDKKKLAVDIKVLKEAIEDQVLDRDLFLREAKQEFQDDNAVNREKFLKVLMNEFIGGKPLEIIDGDTDTCERKSLTQIMKWLADIRKENNKPIHVITILGPQSSGKSTLMNYLFGAKFTVSAGRCTKGLNAMLLKTGFPDLPDLIILDSEGIFSVERDDPKYDRRLAIFCMSISNLLLINIKGEINMEVQKVLQIAIYAIDKLTEAKQTSSIPEIKFILRDQVESSGAEAASAILKEKLNEAAQAAGTTLDKIIRLESQQDKFVKIYPNAFNQVVLYEDKNKTVTSSSEVFRNKCDEFRLELLSPSCDASSQSTNFSGWAEAVDLVWTAVIQNENLIVLNDLASINNLREVMKKLQQFRQIMSDAKEKDEKGQYPKPEINPLFVSDNSLQQNNSPHIEADQTIFARAFQIVKAGIEKCKSSPNEYDTIVRRVDDELYLLKQAISQECEQQVKNATSKMDYLIQNQSIRYIQNAVKSIFEKTESIWKEKQASATISNSVVQIEQNLKSWLLDKILKGKNPSLKHFNDEIQKETDQKSKMVKQKFVKDSQEYFEELALREFQMISSQQMKSSETDNLNQDENRQENIFNFQEIKKAHSQGEAFLLIHPSKINQALISNYYATIEQQSLFDRLESSDQFWSKDLKDAKIALDKLKQKNKGFFVATYNVFGQLVSGKSQNVSIEEQNFNEKLNNLFFGQFESLEYYLINDCLKLMNQINTVITERKEINKQTITPQGYPQQSLNDLVSIFSNKLKTISNRKVENNFSKVITYKTTSIKTAFNQIMFSELIDQAKSNEDCNSKQIDKLIFELKDGLKEFYVSQTKSLGDINQKADGFVTQICEVVCSLLSQNYIKDYDNHFRLIDTQMSKQILQDMVKLRFKNTNIEQEIIDHMKDPEKFEKQLFDEWYCQQATLVKDQLQEKFKSQVNQMVDTVQKFLDNLHQSVKEDEKISKMSETKTKSIILIQYIFDAIIFQILQIPEKKDMSLNDQLTLCMQNEILITSDKKEHCGKIFMIQTSNDLLQQYEIVCKQILILASKIPDSDVKTFLKLLNMKFQQKSDFQLVQKECITKTIEEQFLNLSNKLQQSLEQKPMYKESLKKALGCSSSCYFCGARCKADFECDKGATHSSDFHRPMAFKGSYEEKLGKKILLRDYCVSQTNFASRWQKTDGNMNEMQKIRQRLHNEDKKVKTTMNVYLSWNTGSDLDINVMCGCKIWHGIGSGGDYYCRCDTCGMVRDRDVMTGKDNRSDEDTVEHVYFANPDKLKGKTIGYRVLNWSNNTQQDRNDFKICIFNQYGYQLAPARGNSSPIHDPKWMFCSTQSHTFSQERFYTFTDQDIAIGWDSGTVSFPEHASLHSSGWPFSQADVMEKSRDEKFKSYIQSCRLQWSKVKSVMCNGFELLDDCTLPE